MKRFIIGVDIGGTNTDAVVIERLFCPEQCAIRAFKKVTTTSDIVTGFSQAIKQVLLEAGLSEKDIIQVNVGTTHATNALLEKKELLKVGVIRIAGQRPDCIGPCAEWPDDVRDVVFASYVTIDGGYECDGRQITPFQINQVPDAVEQLICSGAQSIVVIGAFSSIYPDQELQVRDRIKQISDIDVTMSYQLGGMGFIERENASILNAALKQVLKNGFSDLESALQRLGLTCPLKITQNNGTLIDLATALEFPILTLSAGPTNSFIGGARLAGLTDCVVVDIGGTSTDIGIVENGFARRSINSSMIAGIKLNSSMPDVISCALGGGSFITSRGIGPESVGKQLEQRAQCFGGTQLTLTDIALHQGLISIDGAEASCLSLGAVCPDRVIESAITVIEGAVRRMRGVRDDIPMVLVGGGGELFSNAQFTVNRVTSAHAAVANAYGAALAEVSGTIDTVVSLTDRVKVLDDLIEQASHRAIESGARPETLRVVNQQIIPYQYSSQNRARVIITVVGKS